MRNLILTGGIRHDFDASTAALIDLLHEVGIRSEATTDIEAGVGRLATDSFDLLTVMALRWRMEDPRHAPHRNRWAYSMSPEARRMLRDFVDGGGGLFGLHTACICFDDWADWRQVLGGVWVWGQSFHPPHGPVSAALTPEEHPLTAGLAAFDLVDEVYSGLCIVDDVRPLLTAKAKASGGEEPVLWARRFGRGRVAFDALGHDRASLEHGIHKRVIQRCAAWAGGFPDETVERF